MCHSDWFLLPSSTESFGLAALEAMASKVAVISSNAGGLSEININGKTGYTSDFDNIDYKFVIENGQFNFQQQWNF